jgi:nucleoside-diphosphate-sugar epimerase
MAVVTGAAGFIGSHLVEELLRLGAAVRGLDNFATGTRRNIDDAVARSGAVRNRFTLVEGDVRSPEDCVRAMRGVDVVFHEAALNSVPRSLEMPLAVLDNNVMGTATVLETAVSEKVRNVVYASSSSIYGSVADPTRVESRVGAPMSPYAASKRSVEALGDCYQQMGAVAVTGLRYFNVFGTRQNDNGPYAAVIPRWIHAMINDGPVQIFGDGTQTRDFTHVSNVVHANLLAYANPSARGEIFNVGTGTAVSLLDLFRAIRAEISMATEHAELAIREPEFRPERPGDVRSAIADISKIRDLLGYEVRTTLSAGIADSIKWFATADL